MVMPGAPSPAPATHQAYYLDALENVLKGPGDDASLAGRVRQALHGEGLPAARLAVGKDGAVVALSDALRGGTQPGAQLAQHGRAQGYLLTQGPAPPAPPCPVLPPWWRRVGWAVQRWRRLHWWGGRPSLCLAKSLVPSSAACALGLFASRGVGPRRPHRCQRVRTAPRGGAAAA